MATKRLVKPYRIVGLHRNITSVFLMKTGQSYNLKALTPAQQEQLVAIGWPHIKMKTP